MQSVSGMILGSGYQPFAEIVGCKLQSFLGAISWIDLGVDDVTICQQHRDEVVDMRGEGLKARFVAHKAMYVDEKQPPSAIFRRGCSD